MTTRAPRGIRNNNPFNIEYNGTKWQGLNSPPSDGRFCRFVAPEWGIRAGCRILMTYQRMHRLRDITSIINRFAPPSENDTGAYIRSVCKAVGVGPNDRIDVTHAPTMMAMVRAIIRHENGRMPYEDEIIRRGMELAGITFSKEDQ